MNESKHSIRRKRLRSLTEQTFGNAVKAQRWLQRPLSELNGKTPFQVMQTETGVRMIETILGKIAWGAAA